mmetsp:Transcript_4941/g.15011  ORF Transcript_4941/g.15011 Transcript_4941/m.15011 type:complete len:307 (+) Transcript_4941:91-1011(+)
MDAGGDGRLSLPRRVLLDTGDGLRFVAPQPVSEAEFLYHEIFVRQSYLQHGVTLNSKGSPVVIDAGANIGLFGLFCMKLNPRTRVVACEPSPSLFPILQRNVAAHDSVKCVRLALGAKYATARIHCFSDAPAESSTRPAEREQQRRRVAAAGASGISSHLHAIAFNSSHAPTSAPHHVAVCDVRTVSWLMREEALPVIDLLKVDVEGDELEVIRGILASDWSRIKQVVAEVHDVNGRLDRIVKLLRRHRMTVVAVRQSGGLFEGYQMVIPHELRLYYVYATRRPRNHKRPAQAPQGGGRTTKRSQS